MRKSKLLANPNAVSEVLAGILLVLIAIITFSAIYNYVFPVPIPDPEPNVHIMGYVTDSGDAIIEHMGGEILSSYEIYVDGELNYKNGDNDPWEIGEKYAPDIGQSLLDEDDKVRITVYSINQRSKKQIVFDGVLSGKDRITQPFVPSDSFMLISSLKTDTTDEDLICYNNGSFPTENITSYIFKWIIDGNSFADVLMPFDSQNSTVVKDYSDNSFDGQIAGPTWNSNGIVGGSYFFDGGSDYIELSQPEFLNDLSTNDFTISLWIKSNDILDDHRIIIEGAGDDDFFLLMQYGTEIHFGVFEGGIKKAVRTEELSSNIWYHIAAVWDSSDDHLVIYLNGVPSTEVGYRNYAMGIQNGLDLGHGTASSRYWWGYMDELLIINKALSENQIYQLYLESKDGIYNESVIVSEETTLSDSWQCVVIPNDSIQDLPEIESNILTIKGYGGGQ